MCSRRDIALLTECGGSWRLGSIYIALLAECGARRLGSIYMALLTECGASCSRAINSGDCKWHGSQGRINLALHVRVRAEESNFEWAHRKKPGPITASGSGADRIMFLGTKSGPLYYEISGDGPPIVFVSGWAMSSECWRPAVALLKQRHRCLIYDARGTGRSQPFAIDATFTIEDHAEDLHSLLGEAEIYDAPIVGHEMGSLIAALNASRHPQDLRSLIVVSPRRGFSESDVKDLAVFTPAALALRELAGYPILRNLVARRFRRAPQPYRDLLFKDFSELSPRAAYETALSASSGEAVAILEDLVGRTAPSTLLVCGEKDKKGATEARRLFSLARAAKLATLRDCGFLPMLEYRRQFVKLIEDFVARGKDTRDFVLART